MTAIYAEKDFLDGRHAEVYALTFGRARLGVRPKDSWFYDNEW